MAKTYTIEEDRVCIEELVSYRKHMRNIEGKSKEKHGIEFTRVMLQEYSKVWNDRKEKSLYLHMNYLSDVAAARIEAGRIKDENFFGILLEEDETIEHVEIPDLDEYPESPPIETILETSTSDATELYELSQEEIEKLISFVGHGDLLKSELIFLSNEEGLGGYELNHAIQAKFKTYGNYSECCLNSGWRDGHYAIPEIMDDPYKENMKETRGTLKEDKQLFSPMLEFQARIALHLQDPNRDWFLKKEYNEENYQVIKEYYQNNLYKQNSKLNLFLMDLRPFPRRNESNIWPYSNLDRLQYLKAFNFKNTKLESYYNNIRDKRAQYLKDALEQTPAKVIVGIGDKESKKRFFETYFSNRENPVVFEKIKLTINDKFIYEASITINAKTIKVYLSDFFNNQVIGLKGLEILAKDHLVQCFHKSEER